MLVYNHMKNIETDVQTTKVDEYFTEGKLNKLAGKFIILHISNAQWHKVLIYERNKWRKCCSFIICFCMSLTEALKEVQPAKPRWPSLIFLFLQHVPNLVTGIHTIGQRVIVSDVQESLFWVRYRRNENQLIIFADETYPRWVTTACQLDYDTMAAADKFGNICIVSVVTCLVLKSLRQVPHMHHILSLFVNSLWTLWFQEVIYYRWAF